MALIKIACPQCQASLKSAASIAVGAKIKCPKCGSMFLHQPEEEIAEYAEVAERDEEIDMAEPDEERPRKKLKKKKPRDNRTLIMAVSIGAVVLLLAGGTYAAFRYFRSPTFDEPLAYLPASSGVIWNMDLDTVGSLGLQPVARKGLTEAGIAPSECKTKTDLEFNELFHQQTTVMPQMSLAAMADAKLLTVYRSKVPFNQSKVVDFLKLTDPPKTLNGKKYYPKTIKGKQTAAFFPSNRLIVWMHNYSESDMQPILDADGSKTTLPAPLLESIEIARAGPSWLVLPIDASMRQGLASVGMMGGLSAEENTTLRGVLDRANSLVAFTKIEGPQLQLNARLQCTDAAAASQASAELQRLWEAKIKARVGAVVQNINFSAQGNQAQITVGLDLSSVRSSLDPLNFGAMPGAPRGGGR